MTGSGTQESPYIVTGWEEFLSVCNVSTSTYVEWNNGEVDFIEIKSNIRLYKVKWKKFVSRAKIAFKISGAKIDLEEFEFTDAELFHPASSNAYDGAVFSSGRTSSSGHYTIKNCVFSYRQDSAGKGGFIKYAGKSDIIGTSMNIKSICAGEYAFEFNSTLEYSECNINFDIQAGSLYGGLRAFSSLTWNAMYLYLSVADIFTDVFTIQINVH